MESEELIMQKANSLYPVGTKFKMLNSNSRTYFQIQEGDDIKWYTNGSVQMLILYRKDIMVYDPEDKAVGVIYSAYNGEQWARIIDEQGLTELEKALEIIYRD